MAAMKIQTKILPLLLVAAGCATTDEVADLAVNELLYADVPFRTKAPGDRDVFVAPIEDKRDAQVLPRGEKGYPITYGGDDFWERPVREMVADVLQRQLVASALFANVTDSPSAQSIVVKPVLTSFTTGTTESMYGRTSFAEVTLQLTVFGPSGADGRRPVLLERSYGNRQLSETRVQPVSPYRLIGRALQISMSSALAGLDGSNVGRTGVPFDMGAPPATAEAASPR